MKLDGTNEQQLVKDLFDVDACFNFRNGYLYFVKDQSIVKMKTDGTGLQEICKCGGANTKIGIVDDDYIYFINSKDEFLYRVNADGSGLVEIQ